MVVKREFSTLRNWQDWVTLVLGVWLFVSPWQLHFIGASQIASDVAWVIGALLFVVGLLTRFTFHLAEEVIDLVLGLCLIISPWVLGYTAATIPASNAVIVGALVSILSLWEMWDTRHGVAHPA